MTHAIATVPSCAICGKPAREFTEEPLGRNGMMVRVCAGCTSEKPHAREVHRGYESGVGAQLGSKSKAEGTVAESPADRNWRRGIGHSGRRGVDRATGAMTDYETSIARRVPGRKLYRIAACGSDGKQRDAETISRIARSMPWYEHAEYLCRDSRWFCWQDTRDER